MAKTNLSAERLREFLHYDPETGVFTWRVRSAHRVQVGNVAGHTNQTGYTVIRVENVLYGAHRLAWLYMTGEWPENHVDHIDGNQSNNSFKNLREATPSQNQQNLRSSKKNNKSGLLGVIFEPNLNRWRARIYHSGKSHYIGVFRTKEAAHAAYLAAKRQMHEFCTI